MNRRKLLIIIFTFTLIITLLLVISVRTKKYQNYSISEEKWDSLKKEKEENKDLKITEIEFNEYELIIDENNSKLYYSVINNNKNKYNPSVRYESNTNKTKIAILKDNITDEKIGNYEFNIMIYTKKYYHIYKLTCTKFPVLNITTKDDKEDNIPISIYLFDNLQYSNNRIILSDGRLKVDKNNNYKMYLELLSPGRNIRENKISIMGMEISSKYILSLIKLNSDSNIKYEDNHILELFINNEYIGLYKIEIIKN